MQRSSRINRVSFTAAWSFVVAWFTIAMPSASAVVSPSTPPHYREALLDGNIAADSCDINDLGDAVGTWSQGTLTQSYLYSNGSLFDISDWLGPRASYSAINGLGVIAGGVTSADSRFMTLFTYYRGIVKPLRVPSVEESGYVSAINNEQQAVGQVLLRFSQDSGRQDAFLWDSSGSGLDLALLPGSPALALDSAPSIASELNDHGLIVGAVNSSAVYWLARRCSVLPTIGAHPSQAVALGVNNSGVIVGVEREVSPTGYAVVWSSATRRPVALPYLNPKFPYEEARSINDSGDIVGTAAISSASPYSHAVLYHAEALYDLNDLLVPGPHAVLTSARKITNAGYILCEGYLHRTGPAVQVLLVPVGAD